MDVTGSSCTRADTTKYNDVCECRFVRRVKHVKSVFRINGFLILSGISAEVIPIRYACT